MAQDILHVARNLNIAEDHLIFYGKDKAKVSLKALENAPHSGKLILVSAITPTPAGEGKTTVSIGLSQGLQKIGQKVALALRQPSMGPVFGRKGGATGGGKSSLTPSESINLHFTGDFHAITSAHNLLSSAIDNLIASKRLKLKPEQIIWKRVMDMNDRSLRSIVTNHGSKQARTTGFDITAASEIMALLCLSESLEDLRNRLDRIVIGGTQKKPVYAREIGVTGAMMALLLDALSPNLVQSLEGVPAFVHGGPFANIAHGCNSVLASRMALAHADFAVTEAGFAFDLGGEKFLDLKCRQSGLKPALIVIVATVRALKMHGEVPLDALNDENVEAVKRGLANLEAHLDSAKQFQRPVVVAINQFHTDTEAELQAIHERCRELGVPCATANVFAAGGEGAVELAHTVLSSMPEEVPPLPFLYESEDSPEEKLHKIATKVYGARGVVLTEEAKQRLAQFHAWGVGNLPICMAKTQNSLSDQPDLRGRPRDFEITVRDFEIANGAGFLVALTGKMMRMPALPKIPAAERIEVSQDGVITGI